MDLIYKRHQRATRWAEIKYRLEWVGLIVALLAILGGCAWAAHYSGNRAEACKAKGGSMVQGTCLDIKSIEVP